MGERRRGRGLCKARNKGFTLVELLVVIAIIGILAGSFMLISGGATAKAEASKIVSNLRTLKSAALLHYTSYNTWPSTVASVEPFLDRKLDSSGYGFTATGKYVYYSGEMNNDLRSALAGMASSAGLLGATAAVSSDGSWSNEAPYAATHNYVGMRVY